MKRNITPVFLAFLLVSGYAQAYTRGIYITQSTAQNSAKLNALIAQSKKYGIDTFVIDLNEKPNRTYTANVKRVIESGVTYVARVVIFPHGGTHAQVTDKRIWDKRLTLAKYGAELGAKSIQLDYIRYHAERPGNPEKVKYILKVVEYFKTQLKPYNVKLQMDIFGVAADKPAHTIGQDVSVLASAINAFCPMVYPSHYEPYREHAVRPYSTVYNSVAALKKQLKDHPEVAVYPYIEVYNYRYKLSHEAKMQYIASEIKAAKNAGSDGFYVWSPNNHYGPLFEVLARGEKLQASLPAEPSKHRE
ncbi:MAG: putative glycoside hydrolase [Coxiellaceae bacterium]|nr:putative glycoside hydrolase [Coxiellaceae bacterium]